MLRINGSGEPRPEGSSGFVTRLFGFEHIVHLDNRIRVPVRRKKQRAALVCGSMFAALLLCCGQRFLGQATQQLQLKTPDIVERHNVKAAAPVDYRGRRAMLITDAGAAGLGDARPLRRSSRLILPGWQDRRRSDRRHSAGRPADVSRLCWDCVSGFGRPMRDSNASTCGRRTGGLRTNYNEITPRNTSPCRVFPGTNCGRRLRESMNPMST